MPHFTVIAYDIVDDKRRLRVMKAVENFGDRVQDSVYEVLLERPVFERLRRRIADLIDPQEDTVRYYHLCAACWARIERDGVGPEPRQEQDLMIL
jgi:CRISPR-associated protein Cas2